MYGDLTELVLELVAGITILATGALALMTVYVIYKIVTTKE